jgi:putative endonuclease
MKDKLGEEGEELAVQYLSGKGYRIIERNWRYKHKEIDIIARDKDELVFVEVKARSGNYFEEPWQSVTRQKQRFLIAAANAYVLKFDLDIESRFDVISVTFLGKQHKIEHIDYAFYPGVS